MFNFFLHVGLDSSRIQVDALGHTTSGGDPVRVWGSDPLTFWHCGDPYGHGPPLFSVTLLYMACNPWYQFC